MGASHVVLQPGAWSSQRHWHYEADEIVIMLQGEAVLVENGGETLLRAGNKGESACYPDINLQFGPCGFTRKDGSPFN